MILYNYKDSILFMINKQNVFISYFCSYYLVQYLIYLSYHDKVSIYVIESLIIN